MNRLTRIALIILGIVAVFALVIGAGAYYATRQPFPETDGSLTVPGLQDEVHILRDQYGIPHIYAQNQHDLFVAQGYVTAQDRFGKWNSGAISGKGRLSEIAGEATVENDKFIVQLALTVWRIRPLNITGWNNRVICRSWKLIVPV